MNTTTPLYPLARTGLRDHGDLEAFRQRQHERTRRIRDAWRLSNSIASMACGLNVRGDK